ncbi:helix-turn-helix domain-containing protein [Desulfoscipio sp. XC116]|uniref:helix-turn-helix domain-containing protein n=1 Tax=Desulfoscipio sp. XC116 TaxID=3144975 RepID=UPI00325B9C46
MNRVREIRKQKGLSQFGLAMAAEIHPSVISRIECEVWPPYPKWRRKLAAALGVSENELFSEVPKQ